MDSRVDKKRKRVGKHRPFFFLLTIILCVLLFFVNWTGGAVHTVLGMVLIVISIKHSCYHNKRMGKSIRKIGIVNQVLLFLLGMLFVSGILIHFQVGLEFIKIAHVLSGLCFVAGLILHIL